MSVTVGYQPKAYVSDGSLTPRTIEWPLRHPGELVVTVDDAPRTLNASYQVTGSFPFQRIVPMPGFASNGQTVRYRRRTLAVQDYSISGQSLSRDSLEGQLDRQALVMQEHTEGLFRSLMVPTGESGLTLPRQSARAGKVRLLGHSATGALAMLDPTMFGKGDPGGNAMAIGLFAIASTLTIANGTDRVITTGYDVRGSGSASYAYDPDVDAAFVAAHPQWSFLSANGRGFKLDEAYPTVSQFGAIGDNVTDNTAALQGAIDYAHNLYVTDPQLGGGIRVFIPRGRYKTGGLIMKNGVNLVGDGMLNSQLRFFGENTVGIAASADSSTQLAASNLYYGRFENFALYSWEGANALTPVNQVGWDLIGFRWWRCISVYFGWGAGFTGIRGTGAILGGEGGPSQWYNECFGCLLHRHYLPATGGVGMLLGDKSMAKEQVTTLRWYGGDVRGQGGGTGVSIQSGTGIIFDGTTFEGLSTGVSLGSADGTRQAHSNDFRSCYFEGNGENWHIHTGCTDNSFLGGFVTGVGLTDNGTRTRYNVPAMTQAHLSGATSADFWRVRTVNGGVYRPQFIDQVFPSIELVNATAGSKLILAHSTFGTSAAQFYVDDLSTLVAEFGGTSAKLRANNLRLRDDDAFGFFSGAGSPEGVITAKPGSQYLNTSGGAAVYFKETGTGNTGWVAK